MDETFIVPKWPSAPICTEAPIFEGPYISSEQPSSSAATSSAQESSMSGDARWQACNICLDEFCQTELRTHGGCEDCVLCENCIEMSHRHHGGGSIPCPVCQTQLVPDSLFPVAKRRAEKPKARILRVPVVYRVDTESSDNNKRGMALIGHPTLLSLPSHVPTDTLQRIIQQKITKTLEPFNVAVDFTLIFVDGRGYNCSRCLFSSHCRGCNALKSGDKVGLQTGDTLCVRLTDLSSDQKERLGNVFEHNSLLAMRQKAPLTLYDCLRAFTQSETLEENDSWFCPKCDRKQQATKTISVWKYPPYLIIHLERFLFHGTISTKLGDKVVFPQDGLDLSDFVSGGDQSSSPLLYNLYSSVCHMGVAQAGHYTALVRSPVTNEWHYFNDDSVTRQKLKEEEYSTSYLLFYHRQGTDFDLSLPKIFAFSDIVLKEEASASSSTSETLAGCRKKVCLQEDGDGRRAIASSFFVGGDERQRKCSSKASDTSSNQSGAGTPLLHNNNNASSSSQSGDLLHNNASSSFQSRDLLHNNTASSSQMHNNTASPSQMRNNNASSSNQAGYVLYNNASSSSQSGDLLHNNNAMSSALAPDSTSTDCDNEPNEPLNDTEPMEQ